MRATMSLGHPVPTRDTCSLTRVEARRKRYTRGVATATCTTVVRARARDTSGTEERERAGRAFKRAITIGCGCPLGAAAISWYRCAAAFLPRADSRFPRGGILRRIVA